MNAKLRNGDEILKRWCILFIISFLILLLAGGGLIIVIDPYFHYHKPLSQLAYKIYDERYQNDGILKHFDYNAIITGTSMTENFKTSEFDELFDVKSVKVPFSGASYREINENLERAVCATPDIKYIIRGLDYDSFFKEADLMRYDSYPDYLYDDNPLNDVKYFLNKTILFEAAYNNVIVYTQEGGVTTSFDDYANWNSLVEFGKVKVLEQYTRKDKVEKSQIIHLNPDNIKQNVIALAKENTQIQFYCFFTPYSIIYWDRLNQGGLLENQLIMEKEAIELLLPYENIHLFSFFDAFDIITNLDNYKDPGHYSEDINSYILKCMSEGKHELTEENYEKYCKKVWEFYTTYDYDELFQ